MITRDIPIRVRYYETDCMGFVHHSNYVRYYETARTEMLRELGMTYPELEAQGIMLPVIDVQSRYVSPAFDDDLLTVRVTLAEMPKVKIRFDYEVFRENGERINTGSVTLAFMNAATKRACRAPGSFLERLKPYFSGNFPCNTYRKAGWEAELRPVLSVLVYAADPRRSGRRRDGRKRLPLLSVGCRFYRIPARAASYAGSSVRMPPAGRVGLSAVIVPF